MGLGLLVVLLVGCRTPTGAATTPQSEPRLRQTLDVVADPPRRGEPTRLFGRLDFFCADRHDAETACVGEFDMPLKPVVPNPNELQENVLHAGRSRISTSVPWAVRDFAPIDVATDFGLRCIRTEAHDLRCWPSKDEKGQRVRVPTKLDWVTTSRSISLGLQICNVDDAGLVECRGQEFCDVGDEIPHYPALAPSQIKGLPAATAVASGHRFACAVSVYGEVHCWGNIDGIKDCTGITPRQVPEIADAVEIEVGYDAACALLASNEVKCWGGNSDGILGVPESEIETSLEPITIPEVAPAVSLESWRGGMIALKANGEVWIWGDDLTSRDENRKARRVPDVERAIDIIAANEFGCALLADHDIRCFGPRVERNAKKVPDPRYPDPTGRPAYEDKQTWIDAPVYDIWYDAPTKLDDDWR